MDDEIASALSRLLLVSGGSERAKQYLEAYIGEEGSLSLTTSTPSPDSVDLPPSPTGAILPPPLLSPTTNPWQEDTGILTHATRPTEFSPRFDIASPTREARFRTRVSFRGDAKSRVRSPNGGSLDWGDDRSSQFTSSVTSVRPQETTKVLDSSSVNGVRSAPPPTSTVSMLPQASDQPLSAYNPSFTPTQEPERFNRCRGFSSSPTKYRRPPHDGSRMSDRLHPDLVAIRLIDSLLSKIEFEAVKSKIRTDPDYIGELPYIKVQNPQYKVKCLVHAPPKNSNSKWYQVSRGTSIGIFNNWSAAAKATQGVPRSVHKSFGTRGEAIVAYQVALLRGEVFLINGKEADEE